MSEDRCRIRIKRGEFEIEVEGDREFVEKQVTELKPELPKPPEWLPTREAISVAEVHEGELGLKKLSLPEFHKQKQPRVHNERVLVFAYWLTRRNGKPEFSAADILACYEEVRIPKPANPHQHISANYNKAYLMEGSEQGLHRLTLSGEEFVEQDLPRRSKE